MAEKKAIAELTESIKLGKLELPHWTYEVARTLLLPMYRALTNGEPPKGTIEEAAKFIHLSGILFELQNDVEELERRIVDKVDNLIS